MDLLLSDLILPQMDGNEMIQRAKQMHPGLPTLPVSGTVKYPSARAAFVGFATGA